MPKDSENFRQIVVGDIEKAKQGEINEFEQNNFEEFHSKKAWFRRIDWNLFRHFTTQKVAPTFIQERFFCSNLGLLRRMLRRKDMKVLLKHFHGVK